MKKGGKLEFHVGKDEKYIVIIEQVGKPQQKTSGDQTILEAKYKFLLVAVKQGNFNFTATLLGNGFKYDLKNENVLQQEVTATLYLRPGNVASCQANFAGSGIIRGVYNGNKGSGTVQLTPPKDYKSLGFKEQVIIDWKAR